VARQKSRVRELASLEAALADGELSPDEFAQEQARLLAAENSSVSSFAPGEQIASTLPAVPKTNKKGSTGKALLVADLFSQIGKLMILSFLLMVFLVIAWVLLSATFR
jgi:hypothetical protein